MAIYKCRHDGSEYNYKIDKCGCCGSSDFFIDFDSYEQLVTTKIQLENRNSQLEIKNTQLENQNSQLETISHKIETDLSHGNKSITSLKTSIKVLSSFLTILILGTMGGGYWGYVKFQELTQNNSNLESTRQNLNSQITTLESDKSSLESKLSTLESDKSSLETRINTLDTNYYNVFSNNHSIYILRRENYLSWNDSVSLSNTSNKTPTFVIEKDSYIDISLYNLSEGGDAEFELFDYNGNAVSNSKQTTGGDDELNNFYVKAGSYYIKVWLYGDKYTSYTLKVYRR